MKKKKLSPVLIAVIVIVLVALGIGAYLLLGSKGGSKSGMMQDGNAFTSIRDALSKSLSLECDITDSEGRKTKAFIKNGAVRADMADPDPKNSGSIIMKDKKLYMWNGKDGFMMDLPDEANAMNESQNSEANQGNQLLNDLDNYKNDCRASVVSDSLFTPPADVTFSDVSNMMKGQMNEDEVKKMMDKYGDDSGT